MTKHEFANAMTFMGDCYGVNYPEKQVATWYLFFADVSYRDFVRAAGRLACTSSYKPTIHALKAELAEISDPAFGLDMKDEWNKARKAIENGGEEPMRFFIENDDDRKAFEAAYGPLDGRGKVDPMDPFTKEILAEMGGVRMLSVSGDSIDWIRREFEKKFTERLAARKKILMMQSAHRTDSEVERLALPGE